MQAEAQVIGHVLDQVRGWPNQGQRSFDVPASHGRQARQRTLQISFGPITLLPPWNDPRGSTEPLPVWWVRVWETEPPGGEEARAWILLTPVETETGAQAWLRGEWYRWRWIVEKYHQCLKTGCRIEERRVQTVEGWIRRLELRSPGAVRWLQWRDLARLARSRQRCSWFNQLPWRSSRLLWTSRRSR